MSEIKYRTSTNLFLITTTHTIKVCIIQIGVGGITGIYEGYKKEAIG